MTTTNNSGIVAKLVLCMAVFGVTIASADTDVYGNAIKEDGNGNITYQFWYNSQTAETMSVADCSSANGSSSVVFEPRYRTSAESNGRCGIRGMSIVIR